MQNVASITLICPGAMREAVYEFYKQQMPQHGWVDKKAKSGGPLLNLQYEKADRLATITITGVAGGVYVIANIISRSSKRGGQP